MNKWGSIVLGVVVLVCLVAWGAAAKSLRVTTALDLALCASGAAPLTAGPDAGQIAAPGDICVVAPGTYAVGATVVVSLQNLTIISSNGALATTITGAVAPIISITANGVTLGRAGQGVTVTGAVGTAGVEVTASQNVTIEDSIITGNVGGLTDGIRVSTPGGNRGLRIVDCQLRNNGRAGVAFVGGSVDDAVIEGSAVETNVAAGLAFALTGSARRISVSNNRITGNGPAGGIAFGPPTIDVEDSDFSGNTVEGNGGPGLALTNTGRAIGLTISGNSLSNNNADNILFGNGLVADLLIDGNDLDNAFGAPPGGNGVDFANTGPVENVSFRNNTVQRNANNGILFINPDDVDDVEIIDTRLRNNGMHNLFINHLPPRDFSVVRLTIEGGVIEQAGDNGIRIVTATANIDFVQLHNVQIAKNGGLGICLRTNMGSIGDVKFEGVTASENQGGAGTPCDAAAVPRGSGAELITLTGNIGPTSVSGGAFANNGGFGLRLDSLGAAGAMGDVTDLEVSDTRFEQNGTRAPAGLGSGLTARGRSLRALAFRNLSARSNNDHGLELLATNDVQAAQVESGEFSSNDRNVDTVGAGIAISAGGRLNDLQITGAKLLSNAQGLLVGADRGADNHLNQSELGGNRRAGVDATALLAGEDLDATQNYWGHSTGPQHPSNPGGQGDSAVGKVQVVPFLTSGAPTGAVFSITALEGPTAPDPGVSVTYRATVQNTGTIADTQEVTLRILDATGAVLNEVRQTPTLAPGDSAQVSLAHVLSAGTFTVEARTAAAFRQLT
ncbi:MAG: hypothetical protein GWN58_55215, partial [Anaerolineae bacterium]|nr:hypothetical protein [Anaerolineae bacterium]